MHCGDEAVGNEAVGGAGSHLAPGLRPPLLVHPGNQQRALGRRSVLRGGGGGLRHGFEQSERLALGPPTSDPFPDGQSGQGGGEPVGGLHGAPARLGGGRQEGRRRFWKSHCRRGGSRG